MARSTAQTIENTKYADALSALVRETQLSRIVCTTGITTHKTKADPNPKIAQNKLRDAGFLMVKITKQATRQTINVGNCINNTLKNILM